MGRESGNEEGKSREMREGVRERAYIEKEAMKQEDALDSYAPYRYCILINPAAPPLPVAHENVSEAAMVWQTAWVEAEWCRE